MAILGPCTTLESSEVVGDRSWRRPSLHPAADRASNRQLTGNLQQHPRGSTAPYTAHIAQAHSGLLVSRTILAIGTESTLTT